jgi:hypothetical protein
MPRWQHRKSGLRHDREKYQPADPHDQRQQHEKAKE